MRLLKTEKKSSKFCSLSRASLIFEASTNPHLIKQNTEWRTARREGVDRGLTSLLIVPEGRTNLFQYGLIYLSIYLFIYLNTGKYHTTSPCPWLTGKKNPKGCGCPSASLPSSEKRVA